MRRAKYWLILIASILNFLSLSYYIYTVVLLLKSEGGVNVGSLFMYIVPYIIGLAISSGTLIYSIWGRGKNFYNRMTAFRIGYILTLFLGSILSFILLIVASCLSDIVVMNTKREVARELRQEEKEQREEEKMTEEKKKEIANLRSLREQGIITEEEFKKRLMELL